MYQPPHSKKDLSTWHIYLKSIPVPFIPVHIIPLSDTKSTISHLICCYSLPSEVPASSPHFVSTLCPTVQGVPLKFQVFLIVPLHAQGSVDVSPSSTSFFLSSLRVLMWIFSPTCCYFIPPGCATQRTFFTFLHLGTLIPWGTFTWNISQLFFLLDFTTAHKGILTSDIMLSKKTSEPPDWTEKLFVCSRAFQCWDPALLELTMLRWDVHGSVTPPILKLLKEGDREHILFIPVFPVPNTVMNDR